MPVELIEVTSPPKAHKGRGLQHKRKVKKVKEVKEIMKGEKSQRDQVWSPNQEVLGHETRT